MCDILWEKSKYGQFYSHQHAIWPQYCVTEASDDKGWYVGICQNSAFAVFVPLMEDGKKSILFQNASDAKMYVKLLISQHH